MKVSESFESAPSHRSYETTIHLTSASLRRDYIRREQQIAPNLLPTKRSCGGDFNPRPSSAPEGRPSPRGTLFEEFHTKP
eukprot:scaffold453_cov243-Pinguiococcus_pyrenoidosus.AAC.13